MVGLNVTNIKVKTMEKGTYFGEVGLITQLKRTANVTSMDYCTLSHLSKSALDEAHDQFPEIYQSLREKIKTYNDFDMKFKLQMVRNIPYFRNIDSHILYEIMYMLKPKLYEAGSLIVAAGDEVNDVYLLRSGSIVVEVPIPAYLTKKQKKDLLSGTGIPGEKVVSTGRNNRESIYLDWLNEGSCFCIYTAFTPEQQ